MSIDWRTLALQTVNILILVWLLQKFFWRPVAAMIQQRRETATSLLSEAEQKRREAAAGLAEIAKIRTGFGAEREAILSAAQAQAAQLLASGAADAGKAALAMEEAARSRLESERAAAETAWRMRAAQLAVDIAGRLAARLDGAQVRPIFLDWLLREIEALPASVRHSVATGDAAVEAITASPLDTAEQERTARLIAQAFGGKPKFVFKADPALIAGIELRSHTLLMRNSWRADLEKILEGIVHDHRYLP